MPTFTDSNLLNGLGQDKGLKNNAPFLNGITAIMKYTFTITPGASTVCQVAINQLDGYGSLDTNAAPFIWWLSDSAAGVGLTATTASGTVVVKSASGADFGVLTAKKCTISQPLITGVYTALITDSAKTGFYIAVQNPFTGQVSVSRQLVTADYGA